MRGLKVSCDVSSGVIKYHGSRGVDVYNFAIKMINTFTPKGHLVETGVWKGGASILMSHIVYACCGLWFVVCGLWFVVCCLWFLDFGLCSLVCGLCFLPKYLVLTRCACTRSDNLIAAASMCAIRSTEYRLLMLM